jgi:hypothetical protein
MTGPLKRGSPEPPRTRRDLGLPSITVSGYIDLGQAYDLPKVWAYNYQYSDSVTWIHGRRGVCRTLTVTWLNNVFQGASGHDFGAD